MHFQYAITRLPADTFSQGISTSNLGKPDIALALAQHQHYVAALQKAGLDCVVLPPAPAFPDSVFVEDTAVVTGDLAVISRPGAISRRDEIEDMSQILATRFQQVAIDSGTRHTGWRGYLYGRQSFFHWDFQSHQSGRSATTGRCACKVWLQQRIRGYPSHGWHFAFEKFRQLSWR